MAYGGLKYINGRRAEIGSNPPVVSKHQIQPEYGDEQAGAEPMSRDQNLRSESGQGNMINTLAICMTIHTHVYP